MAYSFIGFQTAYIATNWNPIYWNTACLIVNSGSLESSKEKSTDYTKIAKALGNIINKGIKVSLIDINESDYGFKPDADNNEILFGLKSLNGVGDAVIEEIINKRPYTGIKDFINRCPLNKTVMISLIKSGAFDKIDNHWAKDISEEPRKAIMAYYIWRIYDKKKRITLQNMAGLIKYNLLPEQNDNQIMARRIYEFNRYLKAKCKNIYDSTTYLLDDRSLNFLAEINKLDIVEDNKLGVKVWDKYYQEWMDIFREWIAENKNEILTLLNNKIFIDTWNKYAKGTISAWEMQSLCFYYHEHELKNIDNKQYGISDFNLLSSIPEVDYYFKRGGKSIPIYKTFKIAGTVLGKDDTRSSVTILTTTGVVNVKFTKEHYAMYNKQISEIQSDGTKKVQEKGWFGRGNIIMVTGFRRDDSFVVKTYKHTPTHSIYLINNINGKKITLNHNRFGMED